MWPMVRRYRLSVDSRSMFGRYFADRSPTYHRRNTDNWLTWERSTPRSIVGRYIGRYIGWVSIECRPICGPPSAAIGYRLIVGRYFSDGSATGVYRRSGRDLDRLSIPKSVATSNPTTSQGHIIASVDPRLMTLCLCTSYSISPKITKDKSF